MHSIEVNSIHFQFFHSTKSFCQKLIFVDLNKVISTFCVNNQLEIEFQLELLKKKENKLTLFLIISPHFGLTTKNVCKSQVEKWKSHPLHGNKLVVLKELAGT